MATSEMIERVAKAMATQHALSATADPGITRKDWRAYIGMACAAIEAMRIPTKQMVEAVYDPGDGESHSGLSHRQAMYIWEEMIDAALNAEGQVSAK